MYVEKHVFYEYNFKLKLRDRKLSIFASNENMAFCMRQTIKTVFWGKLSCDGHVLRFYLYCLKIACGLAAKHTFQGVPQTILHSSEYI